ncbi:hypothetical protein B0H13DRAFT_1853380 [Mycena leptocephala]|nr:hypothetical protein B0H13DRAFT_1853380 [Mycena leptocephala]
MSFPIQSLPFFCGTPLLEVRPTHLSRDRPLEGRCSALETLIAHHESVVGERWRDARQSERTRRTNPAGVLLEERGAESGPSESRLCGDSPKDARRRDVRKNGDENGEISHSPAVRRWSKGRLAPRRPEEWRTEKSRTALLFGDGPWPRVKSRARQSTPCFAKGARRRDVRMVQRMEGRMEKSRTAQLCGDGPWPGVTSRARQSIPCFAKGTQRRNVRMVQREERK